MKLSEGHHTLKGGYEGGAEQCIHAVFGCWRRHLPHSNSCGLQHLPASPCTLTSQHNITGISAACSVRTVSVGCSASKRSPWARSSAVKTTICQLCRHAVTWDPVNLADLQEALDRKKLNANELITMKTLRDAGVASKKIEFGVKLLAKVWLLTCEPKRCLLASAVAAEQTSVSENEGWRFHVETRPNIQLGVGIVTGHAVFSLDIVLRCRRGRTQHQSQLH